MTQQIVLIAVGVVLFFALALMVSYNRFVSQRNLIRDSWANVDTELKRRYDLIPNLVNTVKGYAAHEKALFESVTATRAAAVASHGAPSEQAADENALIGTVRQLVAVAENYPDLRASDNFLALQRELSNTEDRIQAARRFYNNNVRNFNIRVESFPSNVIARWFDFARADFFEIEEAVRAVPVAG